MLPRPKILDLAERQTTQMRPVLAEGQPKAWTWQGRIRVYGKGKICPFGHHFRLVSWVTRRRQDTTRHVPNQRLFAA